MVLFVVCRLSLSLSAVAPSVRFFASASSSTPPPPTSFTIKSNIMPSATHNAQHTAGMMGSPHLGEAGRRAFLRPPPSPLRRLFDFRLGHSIRFAHRPPSPPASRVSVPACSTAADIANSYPADLPLRKDVDGIKWADYRAEKSVASRQASPLSACGVHACVGQHLDLRS